MGTGGWRGTAGLMALLWLRLCTSTPCCIRSTTARPRGGGGQAEAVAKGGQAALLSHLPHRQGVSGNTAPGPSPSPLLHPAWLVSPMTEPPPATQFSPPAPMKLGTAEKTPHVPLNPACLQAGGVPSGRSPSSPLPPPPRCPWQRRARTRKGTPRLGSTAQPQEEAGGVLGGVSNPSREKLQCHAWATGITNHGGSHWGEPCHTQVSS